MKYEIPPKDETHRLESTQTVMRKNREQVRIALLLITQLDQSWKDGLAADVHKS